MQKRIYNQAEQFLKKRHKWKMWQKMVGALACVVVFCTVNVLTLPALTMEGDVYCGLEEHEHTDTCYKNLKKEQVCNVTNVAHTHSDICWDENGELVCTLSEASVHQHTNVCYEIVNVYNAETEDSESEAIDDPTTSEETEIPVVTSTEKKLICENPELEEHVHNDECFKMTEVISDESVNCTKSEHTHTKACYSNSDADVETEADWKKTFEDVTLTGDNAVDVLAIAESQLGYTESEANYIVESDGETIQGYTRYGDWYGVPYGDWCAMYASFCIAYAEVEDMPLEENCQNWINQLKSEEYNLYVDLAREEYIPKTGDLIFFDQDGDAESDHVGIVIEYVEATERESAKVKTIEGNSSHKVRYDEYDVNDEGIMGYGKLPEQTFYCGQQGHVHTEACYDASDNTICENEEHIHTDVCEDESTLTVEEQKEVDAVIAAIEILPTAEEFSEKILAYEDAEDMEGYEAYWTEIQTKWQGTYESYQKLNERQKSKVTNTDKLLAYEGLWGVQTIENGNETTASSKLSTVESASTKEYIELNLYDYGSNINDMYKSNSNYPGFQWNGGAYLKGNSFNRHVIDYIDFGNSLITDMSYGSYDSSNKVSPNRSLVGTTTLGTINGLYVSGKDVTNHPIGMSTGTEVLSRTLIEGYPALAKGDSLSYLFSNSSYARKMNKKSIDGLFKYDSDTGAYSFNSRENHAQYSVEDDEFTLYKQIITPNFITYPFGNFLPFNDITSKTNSTQVGKITNVGIYVEEIIDNLINSSDYNSNGTKKQLVDMLNRYKTDLQGVSATGGTAWEKWSALDAIKDYFTSAGDHPTDNTSPITSDLLNRMYNIDWDVETNFFFGLEMSMNFVQPKDGMTGKNNKYPMKFYFTGDDDVWVYIDDVLFLDLSGIHRHVGGEIDFVNGEVHYYKLDLDKGDVSDEPYKTYTFAELLNAAGKSTDGLKTNGTFKDYTTHSFKMYYMERGSGSSVCRMNFNLPVLKTRSLSISKEVTSNTQYLGNPDYKFQVLKVDSNGKKTNESFFAEGVNYKIYDVNDNNIGDGKTGANGIITLKAGQKAVFEDINESSGKYYVRELLEKDTVDGQYSVTVSGESATRLDGVTIDKQTFIGMDSPIKDFADGSTIFQYKNDVDESKLGVLNINKKLTAYSNAKSAKTFDIQVKLDGTLLPVGTEYQSGTTKKTVAQAGIITISADEKVTISNILAGTTFEVQETSDSARGYTVTYGSGEYPVTVNDNVVTGVVKTSADIQLVVTNAEKGTTVTIQGEKSLTIRDGKEHEYTFQLEEVTDFAGTTIKENGLKLETTTKVGLGNEAGTFSFAIPYVELKEATLPQKYYYKITETPADDTLVNDTKYVIEVTVSKEDGADISAVITNMWKDGTKIKEPQPYVAAFENTLAGDLILSKVVIGENKEKEFNFEIQLNPNKDKTYKTVKTDESGTTEGKLTFNDDGKATISLKSGESLQIKGLAYDTKWTIKETNADGYKVTYEVQQNSESVIDGKGTDSTGKMVVGTTTVEYTNEKQYQLPNSGGIGTKVFAICGIVLMSTAMILFYNKKREGRI